MLPFKMPGSNLTFNMLLFVLAGVLLLNLVKDRTDRFMEIETMEVSNEEPEKPPEPGNEPDMEKLQEKVMLVDEFMTSLKDREEALDIREKEIDTKYQNLKSVKRDIENSFEELNVLKREIEKVIDEKKATNDANISKLAKIYQSTAPEQAGPMLASLDVQIAAQILLKMNNMKAGKIWGFVDPKRAVMISKEMTKYDGPFPAGQKK